MKRSKHTPCFCLSDADGIFVSTVTTRVTGQFPEENTTTDQPLSVGFRHVRFSSEFFVVIDKLLLVTRLSCADTRFSFFLLNSRQTIPVTKWFDRDYLQEHVDVIEFDEWVSERPF